MPRPERLRAALGPYAIALAVTAVAWSVTLLLNRLGHWSFPFLLFFPAVGAAALIGGIASGLTALAASLLVIDYMFLRPGTLLTVSNAAEAGALAVFAAGGLLLTILAHKLSRRLQRERAVRISAERAATQADRLEQFTAALAKARTPEAASEAALQETIYALSADAAALLVISDDGWSASVGRAVGYRPEIVERWSSLPLRRKGPVADAVSRRARVVLRSRDERTREYGTSDEGTKAEYEALVVVPLVIGSRVAAALRLDFSAVRRFSPEDEQFLDAVGARAAQALDRTWQYEAAERARAEAERERTRADAALEERQAIEAALRASEARYRALAARTSRLHELTAALSEALTLDAVAKAVVQQGRIVVGATSGEVMLLIEGGTRLQRLYSDDESWHGNGPNVVLAEGLCTTTVVRTRQPEFIGSFADWQERFPRSASLAADGGYTSTATLPLIIDNATIGVVAFYFTVPVNFDEEYRALLISVAHHCAQALDRSRLYESAERARTDAEAANSLKDEFLSIVSHELRTPLNAILGWASMLRKGSLDSNVANRGLQAIHDNATRQTKLIDELLDFSRIAGGRVTLDLQEIELRGVLRGVVESILPVAAANGLDLQLGPIPPVRLAADTRRLEQVFFNLLGNALKFTAPGGRITVDVDTKGDEAIVRVSDDGVGIDPKFLPLVFDRFRQADGTDTRTYGGLGLGLSIAKQLVEAHGGRIAVDSAGLNHGSTFTVTLPITSVGVNEGAEVRSSGDAERSSQPPVQLDGVRVLVVDDEADSREMMAIALEACGARVTHASSAAEAATLLTRSEYDVLLSDIAMPDEDGYSLIRRLRASGRTRVASIPAAAVTAHAREDERRRALEAGFQLHLAKPLEPSELARAVERLARLSHA